MSDHALIDTVCQFRAFVRQGPYAWPGGYPLYFITADGAALCFKAAKAERRSILEALRDNDQRCGWRVCAIAINYEDPALFCDHTGERIESAYAEDDAR